MKAFILIIFLSILVSLPIIGHTGEKWSGVDEVVIEKIAAEHGRTPSEPLINTDQGDLLLFVFLLAGGISGFVAGYFFRKLEEGRDRN